nr:protein pxr1 [Quercus suber]
MGLSGNKKRIKLSQDPNNTTWSKDTTNYGHRILAQQGWTPGQYLGAENASHSGHYSAANASHIRVLLREDNLGLGAKVGGKANADTFGLSTLSGIFGRLNGKSDEVVQKQEGALRDAELRTYQAQKYGFMNFVSGGLLVGDKMEETKSLEETASSKVQILTPETGDAAGRKRKIQTGVSDINAVTRPNDRKRKSAAQVASADAASVSRATSKTSRELDQAHGKPAVLDDQAETGSAGKQSKKKGQKDRGDAARMTDEALEKARLKHEKKERKIERRKRKEAKRLRREARAEKASAKATAQTNETEVDAATSAPKPSFAGSRHAVRQRYIQQKRLASMDPQALKEILMISAGA